MAAGEVHIAVYNLSHDSEKAEYEYMLNRQEKGEIKITRDEFVYGKSGRDVDPIITIWYTEID